MTKPIFVRLTISANEEIYINVNHIVTMKRIGDRTELKLAVSGSNQNTPSLESLVSISVTQKPLDITNSF